MVAKVKKKKYKKKAWSLIGHVREKKRRSKAALEAPIQSAGEHRTPNPLESIIEIIPTPDKEVKRWRVVIDAGIYYYRIHFLTLSETLSMADGMGLGPRTIYSTFPSFSKARAFMYSKVRSEIKTLTEISGRIRKSRKSQYVNN